MSVAIGPWLRAALTGVAAAICVMLFVGLLPAPAQAAGMTPGSRVFSAKVLATAAAYKGRPYRYGGSGPAGFDCSGYTGFVLRKALGKKLPRTSSAQFRATKRISKSRVRPGDLVFFRSGGRVYHVGIYAGQGRLWHSPYSGSRVRKDKIWTSRWVAGRVR
jgi:cell wall-associated NlpC family hydrolase